MSKRSVVITGAATRIGSACARRFAANSDALVLADADETAVRALCDELTEKGAAVSFVVADAASKLQVHNIVAEALESHNRIDVLVHANFAFAGAPFLEVTQEGFDQLVDVNLKGVFTVNQAVAKQMVKQINEDTTNGEAGAIVNILSVEAVTASADRVVFAATQGGVHQMTKAIALALSDYGIRANAVGIGAIKGETIIEADRKAARETIPLNRVGDPEEAAEAAFFLASPSASYITGQTLYVDGGRLVRSVNTGEAAAAEKAKKTNASP